MGSKKKEFFSALAEALVIRTPKIKEEPKVKHDSFGADLANALAMRPVYQRPRSSETTDQNRDK